MNHLLEPDDTSGEEWVEAEVEKRVNAMEEAIEFLPLPHWFNEYIDWAGVAERVESQVKEEIQDAMDEQAIANWEAKQEANSY